jgi:hypothetical protein
MASDVRFSTTLINAFLNQVDDIIGSGGFIRFYSGTKPATADAALSGNTLLAELALSADSFGDAASRTITAAAITTWASLVTSGGTRVVDLTVGEAADSADITVDNKSFQAGADIAVTSLTITIAL